MSIQQDSLLAPSPSTTRAVAVHLSYDAKSDKIAYASGKSVYVRSVSNPTDAKQFIKHNYNTTVAKFSPSGFYVASADEAGNVKVWDPIGNEMVVKSEFQILNGRINDIAWDADSQRIIVVGDGKERYGHCLTMDTGNTVGEISGHSAPINAVSIRPVRPYRAVTVSDDGGLVFYQGPPFKFVKSVRNNHSNFVRDVRYSDDGNTIVSVGADKKIVLYEGKTGDLIKVVENAHDGGIFSVSWKGDKFVTSSADSKVKLWDSEGSLLKTWSLPKKVENHILGVVTTADYILALTLSGELYYFEKNQDDYVQVIQGQQKSITALNVDNDQITTGAYDGRILRDGKIVEGHNNLVVGILSKPTPVTTAWDDTLRKLDSSVSVKLSSQPKDVAGNSNILAVLDQDGVTSYDPSLKQIDKLSIEATSLDVSEKYIIIGTSGKVLVYDTALKLISDKLPVLRSPSSVVSISPNEKYVAVGDNGGRITLFDIDGGSVKTSRWSFHTAKVNSISWNEDNDHVVSGSLDTNIIIYSVEKPSRNIKALNGHKEGVNGVAWRSQDKIVSVGSDATVKEWSVTY
ncbi:hypothetical protein LJB42_001742 [Komagataella kurtzmanii]|nr:hypothetical protein LJB42_001742 [Komagataella kurtzmanii]